MQKTFVPKQNQIKRNWYLIDAKDKILGRLASRIAILLRGKHKPYYT
ncbi:MAG: uL13 family ribosomal protein, partial [Candidatus Omnitrophica bacterium]|nr:uL13 family ribosomal protein [Candidatus Omnitrophota bacterium]